jgi:two-component system, sensor histidine kinase RegB
MDGPRSDMARREQATDVTMPWLIRLRWASVVALAAAAWAAVTFWRIRLPLVPFIVLLAALAMTNVALVLQLRSPVPQRHVVGGVLIVDILLLTSVLALVGGPLNPFSIVYLVGITIAAVSLGHRWAFAVAVLSSVAYGVTFFYYRPLEFIDPSSGGDTLPLHLYGMWVAFAAASMLIAYFVGSVSEALERREHDLEEARAIAARSERLAALLSLGAGAAHELATPLSTISTAANELERAVQRSDWSPRASDYVRSIRSEVDRCTAILDHLSGRAASEPARGNQTTVPAFLDDVRERLGQSLAGRLDVQSPSGAPPVTVPVESLRQTVIALVRNAFDASAPDQAVTLRIDVTNGFRVEVIDRGHGMTSEVLGHAGEPFFTTKPAGRGLGLGLFLARAFAEQAGGSLAWQSVAGRGTSVVLDLPSSPP